MSTVNDEGGRGAILSQPNPPIREGMFRARLRGAASVFVILILVAPPAAADPGQLQWTSTVTTPAPGVFRGIAVAGRTVVATGSALDEFGVEHLVVTAYDRATGEVVWQTTDAGPNGTTTASVEIADGTVYVGGREMTTTAGHDAMVWAFSLDDGSLVWSTRYDQTGGHDAVSGSSLAVAGGRVFAGGFSQSTEPSLDWFVQALDAATGELLWTDLFDGGDFDHTVSIDADARYVVASGLLTDENIQRAFTVRVYDTATGTLLWEDRHPGGFGYFFAQDVAWQSVIDGNRVVAAGSTADASGHIRMLVRGYEARTGELVWEDEHDAGAGADVAFGLDSDGRRAVAVGSGGPDCSAFEPANCDLVARAYDLRSGTLLWARSIDNVGTDDQATSVAIASGQVVVAGAVGLQNGLPAAYTATLSARTGDLEGSTVGAPFSFWNAVAADQSGAYTAGWLFTSGISASAAAFSLR